MKKISIYICLALAFVVSFFCLQSKQADAQQAALQSLVNAITGNTTAQIVNQTSPLWSFGLPLSTPIINTVSTSTGGTLASSTAFRFEVDATDGVGSTTPSAEVDSVATPYGTAVASVIVNWYQPTNAFATRIYFATSTGNATLDASTPFTQYFVATTSGQYTFSTSTGALTGSPVSQTTAYSSKINPLGVSYLLGGGLGVGTSTVQDNGINIASSTIRATSVSTSTCSSANAGATFFSLQSNNNHFYGCNGSSWKQLDN